MGGEFVGLVVPKPTKEAKKDAEKPAADKPAKGKEKK